MEPTRLAFERLEHERRFVVDRQQADQLLERLTGRLVLDDHHADTAACYSRTTYLDTDRLDYLASGSRSIARRVRIREYASASPADAPPVLGTRSYLELKESAGEIRSKKRVAAESSSLWSVIANQGAGFEALGAGSEAWNAIEAELCNGTLRPRMTSWYRRWSFHAPEAAVRVTIDEGIAYCKPTLTPEAEPTEVVGYGPGRVIEVKHRGNAPRWLTEALTGLPQDPAFSKFRHGMEHMRRAGLVPVHRTRPVAIPAAMAPR